MQKLQTLIDMLTKGRDIHISVLDVSGILNTPLTEVRFENVIHSKKFCNIAKSTQYGNRMCLLCKAFANTKAIKYREAFSGHCFWGIYEAAYPVVINGSVAAVVYVGNAVIDKEYSKRLVRTLCRRSSVCADDLLGELDSCEVLTDPSESAAIAELVGEYIKRICPTVPRFESNEHWLVTAMKRHAENAYNEEISLRELAVAYHKNEKYMGRLFKKETGVSFRRYCNGIRLEKAAELLRATHKKIIDVAMECGFDNVPYFNRIFVKAFNASPSEYRNNG